MPVNIEYQSSNYSREVETVTEDIGAWFYYLVGKHRGIENQIDALQELMGLVIPKLLEDHPELVTEVAKIIECPGSCHKIVEVTNEPNAG